MQLGFNRKLDTTGLIGGTRVVNDVEVFQMERYLFASCCHDFKVYRYDS
jgi:hypothetical protein